MVTSRSLSCHRGSASVTGRPDWVSKDRLSGSVWTGSATAAATFHQSRPATRSCQNRSHPDPNYCTAQLFLDYLLFSVYFLCYCRVNITSVSLVINHIRFSFKLLIKETIAGNISSSFCLVQFEVARTHTHWSIVLWINHSAEEAYQASQNSAWVILNTLAAAVWQRALKTACYFKTGCYFHSINS